MRAEKRLGRAGVAIFAVALALRLLHLWQIREAPFFPLLMGDGEGYAQWARTLAAGDWIGDRIFYQAPLYPYFLGGIYWLAGESTTVVKVVQALLGSFACVLLAGAGLRFFSKSVGVCAGFGLALYAPAIFFDALVQKSSLDVFLVCALLYGLGTLRREHGAARWVTVGASLGALVLTRENALLLLPPVAVFALLSAPRPRRVAAAAWLGLGLTLLLGPVVLRNFAVGGEAHLTSSQFGTNFYIGNGAIATGTYTPLRYGRGDWTHEREDATELAESALGRSLSPGEVSSYWRDRALDDIVAAPGAWLGLLARKAMLLANAAEAIDTEDIYTHAEWSLPLRALATFFHFGLLLPLALLGFFVSWPRRRELWVLHAMVLCYAASVMLFYVVARYRHPLAPMLLLFAASGVVGLPAFVRSCSRAQRLLCATTVLAALVVCNWPLQSMAHMRSVTHRNIAVLLQRQGEREAAKAELRRALEFNPNNVRALHGLAAALQQDGDAESAARLYRAALERKADHAPSHTKLGVLLAKSGDYEAAIRHYRQALESEPELVLAQFQLGLSLVVLGRVDEARAPLREAMRLDPAARIRLTRTVLGTLDRPRVAPGAARASLELAKLAAEGEGPPDARVFEALAAGYAANGRFAEALREAERAALIAGEDPDALPEDRTRLARRVESYRARLAN